jgi:DNA replication protein
MKEIKDIIQSKVFVINEIVLKNVSSLNIDLKEFLLLLYFINVSNSLNTESIVKHLKLSEKEILDTFSSLVNKKLIEVVVNKKGNKIEEEVSLDLFYNKLLMANKTEEKSINSDIYSVFENEFGRTLSPIEYETISMWVSKGIEEETIKKALREAVINGVSNLRYIDKILFEWSKKAFDDKPEENPVIFDYNWLEDDNER